jgi:hypothetical protein
MSAHSFNILRDCNADRCIPELPARGDHDLIVNI